MNAPEQLRAWRKTQGYGQTEAAYRLGYSASAYIALEHGNRRPSLDAAARIEDMTQIPMRAWVA